MKKTQSYGVIIGLSMLLLIACQHDPVYTEITEEVPTTTATPNPVIQPEQNGKKCDKDTVYFSRDVFPILVGNCAFSGCHGDGSARSGVDLTSYDRILATAGIKPFDPNGSDIYEVITETDPDKSMPPNGRLSDTQIAKIGKWISQGALDNTCTDCDTTAVRYSTIIDPIIRDSCRGCHGATNPRAGISLATYDDVRAIALDGALLGVIEHQNGFVPMPFQLPKLDDCKIAQVQIWIRENAPNN